MSFILRKFTDEKYCSFRVQRIYVSGIKSAVLSKINLETSIICGMILGSIKFPFSHTEFFLNLNLICRYVIYKRGFFYI